MKFLLALSVLASSIAFAQNEREFIACYEAARQGGHGELAYLFEIKGPNLHIVFPDIKGGPLMQEHGCLEQPGGAPPAMDPPERLKLCLGEGQRINGLIPVEASFGRHNEETVYCDREIKRYFYERRPEII